MSDLPEPVRSLTPNECLAALRDARASVTSSYPSLFLDGYDMAVDQLARLVDFPWHEREESSDA